MGIVKIYNVLGGFYGYYNSMPPQISVHKVHNFSSLFLCILYSTLVLYFCENRKICTITYQITPQTPSG